ncbi:MAG: ABC transporter permease subunit, partial [Demequinaceae bacterium]|nr:ABC transporter permease subunit [Demequinaceae bacterium]
LVAVDVITLAEAARSLGASWVATMWDVILPNLRRGMLAASFISVAVVLGEYTIASLLSRTNVQTALVLVSKRDPYVSNIVVLFSLVLALTLLFALGRVGAQSRRSRS